MGRFGAVLAIVVGLAGPLLLAAPGINAAQTAGGTPTAAEIPDTPVGDQLTWLIALLNGEGEPPTAESVAAHFTPAAVAQFPPPAVIGLAQQVAVAFGPFAYQGPARPATPNQIVGYLAGRDGASFLVVLATEAAPPHRLTGVALLPAPPPAALPAVAAESLSGRFDVGGRTVFLSCSGTGQPTVILEAGYGDAGGIWAPIQNGLAPVTRVCSYDRPNVSAGASDPAPTPRTAADQVADLHALLREAGVPGPYVLVAHSYGGLVSRLFATTYPDEVAGLVLIDTVHEDRAARRQGMVSLELWAALQDFETQFSDFEQIDQEASWTQVRAAQAASPLRPMPLVVLAAGRGADPSFYPPDWPLVEEERLHQELQTELAALVPNGTYLLAEESGHYIQLEQPALVTDAIAGVIEAARNPAGGTPVANAPATTMPVRWLARLVETGLGND